MKRAFSFEHDPSCPALTPRPCRKGRCHGSSVKRTQRDYTLAFKLAVVEQVEKGELTYREAQQKYGIQGRSTVLVWRRKHGRLGWGLAASSAAMPIDETVGPLPPEQQIKALQLQLGEAQEKARC